MKAKSLRRSYRAIARNDENTASSCLNLPEVCQNNSAYLPETPVDYLLLNFPKVQQKSKKKR